MRGAGEHRLDAVGQEVCRRSTLALVLHEAHIQAVLFDDISRCYPCLHAGGGKVDLAGVGLGIGHEFLHRLRREVRRNIQEVREVHRARDRREVGYRIERRLAPGGRVAHDANCGEDVLIDHVISLYVIAEPFVYANDIVEFKSRKRITNNSLINFILNPYLS